MKMTSSKRFGVRTALVTGTTLATIVGAQALISLDETSFSKTPPAIVVPSELDPRSLLSTPTRPPSTEAPAVAPNIVILRHPGQVVAEQKIAVPQANPIVANPQPVVIQPPNPVQVAVPQPVPQQSAPAVVQQSAPAVAQTHSSR